jgi:hypothetical protein
MGKQAEQDWCPRFVANFFALVSQKRVWMRHVSWIYTVHMQRENKQSEMNVV